MKRAGNMWVILLALLFSCSTPEIPKQKSAPAPDTVLVVAPSGASIPRAFNPLDTILLFVTGPDTQQVTIRKKLVPAFSDFAGFIARYINKPLRYNRVRRLDLTSDGRPELLEANVRFEKGRCLTLRQITQGDQLLWTDTFRVDDDKARQFWGPGYYQLRQQLAFYEAAKRSQFALTDPEVVKQASNNPEVIELRRQQLEARNMEPEAIVDALIDYQEYLTSFKGAVLKDSNPKSPAFWIWYQPERSFVKLYHI